MRYYLVVAMAILVLSVVPFFLMRADAHMSTFPNDCVYHCHPGEFDTFNTPEVQQIGNAVYNNVCAGNVPVDIKSMTITDPVGNAFSAINADHPSSLTANTCHKWKAAEDYPGLDIHSPGTYTVSFNAGTAGSDFVMTFNVVPESPIGSIAMVIASLSALGTFVYFRRYRSKATHQPI